MTKESVLRELNISVSDIDNDKKYINKLKKTEDKVKYLRIIKNYTQEEAAVLIGISSRQVRRIDKKIKMSS